MNMNDEQIELLTSRLIDAIDLNKPEDAFSLAFELEGLLGTPPVNENDRYILNWIAVFEGKGNLDEAIRLGDIELADKISQTKPEDFVDYPKLFLKELKDLEDGLFLQAYRCCKNSETERASKYLEQIFALAKQYGFVPDQEEVYDLERELSKS